MRRGLIMVALAMSAPCLPFAIARVWPGGAPAATAQGKPSARSSGGEPVRFDHAAHEAKGVSLSNCESCHKLELDFEAAPAGVGMDHQPCNGGACHASEFFSAKPVICRVCHDGEAPWEKLKPILRRRARSEFSAGGISHKTHMAASLGSGKPNSGCKHCHGDVFRGEPRKSSGHGVCAPCHGKTAEPAMGNCGDCHQRAAGKADAGRGPAQESSWSVAARFDHRTHAADPRGGRRSAASAREPACVECHATVPEATRIGDIANPAMRTCDGCHDGKHAFKTTGFGCRQCHGRAGE